LTIEDNRKRPGLSAESLIDPIFVDSVQRACRLERLHVGSHTLRDARRWKVGAIHVEGLWIAEIEPTFADPACLAVLTTDQGRRAVFAVRRWLTTYPLHIRDVPTVVGPITAAPDWPDPVAEAFRSLDCRVAGRQVVLDGIGYRLYLETISLQVAVRFANPMVPQLRALEQALLQVGRTMAVHDPAGTVEEYLHEWAPYLELRALE
jgi:hypothetical protein